MMSLGVFTRKTNRCSRLNYTLIGVRVTIFIFNYLLFISELS